MITVKNLTKTFGKLRVFSNISTEIEKGEIISIIGPSGTGKSTFLRCLNRLEEPDSGQILIDGEDILADGVDIYRLRQKMGMVFQSFNLFPHLMIAENIMIGPMKLLNTDKQTAYNEAIKYLGMVGLASKALAYPDELSGGQQQRVAIARTLAMHPEIILFDEPTSALDPTMISEVLGVIRKLAEIDMTMIIVTHEMNFAKNVSTRVFYMDEGTIYEEGTPKEIFDNPRRPKTNNFINTIKSVEYTISDKDFDLYEMNSVVENFCIKNFLPIKKLTALKLLLEETVLQRIMPLNPDSPLISINIYHSEKSEELTVHISYKAGKNNVLEQSDTGDNLSLKLIKNIIKGSKYSFAKGNNILELTI